MKTIHPQPENAWATAAQALARQVRRRERKSALFSAIGPAVCAAGVVGIVVRLTGGSNSAIPVLLGVGALIGLLLGLRRMRNAPQIEPGDAAWALDRVARRGEHGLAAAVSTASAATQAAKAAATPPRVRLLPPRGLAWLSAGVLAAGVAWMAPSRTNAVADTDGPTPITARQMSSGGASAGPADGAASDDRPSADLQTMARVREALDLPASGALPPEVVAQRLSDPATRERIRDAAGTSAVASAIDQNGADAQALAQSLADIDTATHAGAEARRRRSTQAAATTPIDLIPAHRREVVQRYLELLTK